MKAIGGYLPFEFSFRRESIERQGALALNLGRSGLEYILRERRYRRVYAPKYVCPVVFQTLEKVGVEIERYDLSETLDPLFDRQLSDDEALLYVDYFGIKDKTSELLEKNGVNLILDLTQAFFYQPKKRSTDAFNSVRKFIGTPDGAFVFGQFDWGTRSLQRQDVSDYCSHLVMRSEEETEKGYPYFRSASESMKNWDVKRISTLTENILRSISLDEIARTRRENFLFLHQNLGAFNELKIDVDCEKFAPLCYPLLVSNGNELKKKLIAEKIFVPTYWPNLDSIVSKESFERRLIENLICLPVDQNCDLDDMERIVLSLKTKV